MSKDLEGVTSTPLQNDQPAAEEQGDKGHADAELPRVQTGDPDTIAAASASNINLEWNVIGTAPHTFQRIESAAVVLESVVYISGIFSTIFAYDFVKDSWSEIPVAPINGTLVLVNNLLTSLGGGTNKLFSLTGEGDSRIWTEEFPPMPTAHRGAAAVCTEKVLIVAGGEESKKVEVMNTENNQWSTAANLPVSLKWCSMTICDDNIYLIGGYKKSFLNGYQYTNSVYTCSLNALLEGGSLRATLARALSLSKVWKRVADLPVAVSTGVCLKGRLLAIGGSAANAATVAVRMYDPTTDKWKIISHMTQPRHSCFAAVLDDVDNTLLVLGGRGPEDCIGYIEEVEKAKVL